MSQPDQQRQLRPRKSTKSGEDTDPKVPKQSLSEVFEEEEDLKEKEFCSVEVQTDKLEYPVMAL